MVHVLVAAAALSVHRQAGARAVEARAATALYAAVNRERVRDGEDPLRLDPLLGQAALEHVEDMARRHYFDHVSPTGVSPFDRMRELGCEFSYAGENIALAGDEAQADNALFKSAPHRANTLNAHYTRVGIAVMDDADGRLLFVEDFAG